MTYTRAATIWHYRHGEMDLVWLTSTEGVGTRLVRLGDRTWGTNKWDRLPIEDATQYARDHAVCTPKDPCLYHVRDS